MTRRGQGPARAELVSHLRRHREEAGMTQAALAEEIGVTRKTVNTVERGHYVPSTVLALRLAKALRTTVEELFELPDHQRA